ncbi:MAG: hypothetical protein A2Y70_05195 [Candidatus Aminicenantes bacterium RBG_13_64_14]|nr:MAG: hypothetical protein A2Y70_05195 [Candidatus Aminicenantes bacterium RBG_13_64_14]
MTHPLTRRDFLKGTTAALLGASLGFGQNSPAVNKTRVILVRHRDVLDENSAINPDVLQEMLDEAVMKIFDESDPVKAFGKMVKPGETVGIKTNVWSYLPTPRELETAIKRRLLDAGIAEDRIGLDDHTVRTNPLFINATSLINARPLRTHYLSGMSGCIKNYIMFAESQPALHPDSCADLGSLFKLPIVKGKTRLNILCALTPQFHGRGPHHFSRRYVWSYKGLIIGQDPVAVDTIGLRLIMAKRREVLGKDQELPPVPKHIQLADTRHGIGVSDINAIELVKLGWNEDILV